MNRPGEFEELEQQLAADLRRLDPPPGFADDVMLRIASQSSAAPVARKRPILLIARTRTWGGLALAASLLLVVVPGSYKLHKEHERRQAVEIEARYDLAMRLTTRTLAHVDQKIDGTLHRAGALPH